MFQYYIVKRDAFCNFRPHPNVKEIDMLHAADYSNMDYHQMSKSLGEGKKKDMSLAKAMQ